MSINKLTKDYKRWILGQAAAAGHWSSENNLTNRHCQFLTSFCTRSFDNVASSPSHLTNHSTMSDPAPHFLTLIQQCQLQPFIFKLIIWLCQFQLLILNQSFNNVNNDVKIPLLPVLFCLSSSACPILPVLFCLCHSVCPILPVPFYLSRSECPFLSILFCLSHSACSVLPVPFCLSHSACPVLPVLFCLSRSACSFYA